ncbi:MULTISPECIES: hypothetical protein [Haloarcula]|uniref:Uncharacterized protein n=1 Tax=Haloarcula pellucida TaxID=1427151 RepID=A0A830GMC0_9EURY|nr:MULTISPECIES: hypothetical protein [Halomicroarcula]MBX0348473.1 hypothetical protein [Halomicroarcula pellucida]MDS0278297.1 hypothetical protein [Halomicroarcula sp. S1AR25-4]GGN93207.1 hypothetical protein GCM10009030_18340 [Halomicroarcula pellucida]
MSDDFSPFDRRMRWPAVVSAVAGFGLGFVAVFAQRTGTGADVPWVYALPFGALAAAFLFGVMYRNLSKQYG